MTSQEAAMYAIPTAAQILGVTPAALEAALEHGETIRSLTIACGHDPDLMTEAIVDAETADVVALADIAGFGPDAIAEFARELRAYLVAFVSDGQHVADRLFETRTLQPV
ncbi:hypothetical protein E1262_15880 [Jiangella aurantiaca]|uniref:Uncharacterized protein n=1 Tax=Jiangella aurantiaca TaxID=2530373 RepID=A0A4R5ABW4_9ACTN|nr:hypothetical protein [Jiangella aurantiaca]TDD68499.1 hypothetical protein E1262_15880 [Jiangella aurantiaca]